MQICMIVHNNGTRDGRVMREAHALQSAGHNVTVVGIPESGASEPLEILSDGVKVTRINWYPNARRRLLRSAIFRAPLFALVLGGIVYGAYRGLRFAWYRFLGSASGAPFVAAGSGLRPRTGMTLDLAAAVVALVALYAVWYGLHLTLRRRAWKKEQIRRRLIGENTTTENFPALRSRIPDWVPDWLLEHAIEPLGWIGAKTGKFSQYRYRSEELAAAAIRLEPDLVHSHDCVALPTGWLVKKALGIPLIYDAHEIYEAVAARRFGATDYFARIHRKYLPRIDGFIAVNDSAASYYGHAYPDAPRAVVIRNATDQSAVGVYDGRLHQAAGLPLTEKILLYQGGYTKDRGLPTLVRAGSLLPDGWSLVLMGWGPLAGELRAIAAAQTRTSNSAKLHFIPAVPASELLSWTKGAAVGIIPYEDKMLNHWIATPNKLWEYPQAGVPLIVQPFPEMRRVVETYKCGWVLPREFTAAAIAGLVRSLTDEMIATARHGCRRFVQEDSWSAVYRKRLLDLYQSVEHRARKCRAEVAEGPAMV